MLVKTDLARCAWRIMRIKAEVGNENRKRENVFVFLFVFVQKKKTKTQKFKSMRKRENAKTIFQILRKRRNVFVVFVFQKKKTVFLIKCENEKTFSRFSSLTCAFSFKNYQRSFPFGFTFYFCICS